MTRQVLTVGHIDSDGILFKAGTPVEGAMGEFVSVDLMTEDEIPVPIYDEGQSYMNDGDKRTLIAVWNDSGEEATLVIETGGTVDGMAIADRTVVIADGDIVLVRPGPSSVYNQPDGSIYFNVHHTGNVDDHSDLWVAVVKVDA